MNLLYAELGQKNSREKIMKFIKRTWKEFCLLPMTTPDRICEKILGKPSSILQKIYLKSNKKLMKWEGQEETSIVEKEVLP